MSKFAMLTTKCGCKRIIPLDYFQPTIRIPLVEKCLSISTSAELPTVPLDSFYRVFKFIKPTGQISDQRYDSEIIEYEEVK